MQPKYLKISVVAVLMFMVFLSNTAVSQANLLAQSTSAATIAASAAATLADAGAYPPCPQAQPVPTMAATLSATMMSTTMASATTNATMAMAATLSPTMASTMSGTAKAGSAMTVGAFQETSGCTLTATLAGANEVPVKGDPKAKGLAILVISRSATGTGEICFLLTASGLKLPAAAAHIHAGAVGVAGPVIVPFAAPDAYGRSSGCTSGVDRALIDSLLTEPFNYYVNVHNADFPGGAARGQLEAPLQ